MSQPLELPLNAPPEDLSDPRLYLNRELSLVAFQKRVLAQACDESVPLLERLRFLTIVSSIVDEFFEVRVAGLKQALSLGLGPQGPDRAPPEAVLPRIREQMLALIEAQDRELNRVVLPALAEEGIRVWRRSELSEDQNAWLGTYFDEHCRPVLTPLGLTRPIRFPTSRTSSSFIVSLESMRLGAERGCCRPGSRSLPLITRPALCQDGHEFVTLGGHPPARRAAVSWHDREGLPPVPGDPQLQPLGG